MPRISDGDAESELIDLAGAGLARFQPGAFGGWSLTDGGREADPERIAKELEASGARHVVEAAFDRFQTLNVKLLELCTAWQLRLDGESELEVLERFVELHRRTTRLLDDLAETLGRFGRYRTRLGTALNRAKAGAPSTSPTACRPTTPSGSSCMRTSS